LFSRIDAKPSIRVALLHCFNLAFRTYVLFQQWRVMHFQSSKKPDHSPNPEAAESNAGDHSKTNRTEMSPSEALAQRLGQVHSLSSTAYQFLVQPMSASDLSEESLGGLSAGESMTLELVAPLMREHAVRRDLTADVAQSIARGLFVALSEIATHRNGLSQPLVDLNLLSTLLPVYLAVGQNKKDDSLAETFILLAEFASISQISNLLGSDLGVWLDQQMDLDQSPELALKKAFDIDVNMVARQFLQPATSSGGNPTPDTCDRKSIDEKRRQQIWQLAQQWQRGDGMIKVDPTMALERIDWHRLQLHWQDLRRELYAPTGSAETAGEESNSRDDFEPLADGDIPEIDPTDSDSLVGRLDQAQHVHGRGAAGQQSATTTSALASLDRCEEILEEEEALSSGASSSGASSSGVSSSGLGATNQTPTSDAAESSTQRSAGNASNIVEVRSASDPKLVEAFSEQLAQCRRRGGSMALLITKSLPTDENGTSVTVPDEIWQTRFMELAREASETDQLRCFQTRENELAIIIEDLDRPEVAAIARECLDNASIVHRDSNQLATKTELSLAVGISYVALPARSFSVEQLMDSAWRCLSAAEKQGSGSIKTIEVF
jgi:hypothetical protein